jgi:hypothetical protein
MTLLQDAIAWLRRRGFELPARPITFAYQLIKREKQMATKDKGPKAAKSETRGPVGHWADLHPVPSFEEALAGIRGVLDRINGGQPDNIRAIHCGLTVVMFGNAQIPHDEHPPLGDRAAVALGTVDEAKARHVLEGALATHGQADAARDVQALPWAMILQVVVPLILSWLQNRKPANA